MLKLVPHLTKAGQWLTSFCNISAPSDKPWILFLLHIFLYICILFLIKEFNLYILTSLQWLKVTKLKTYDGTKSHKIREEYFILILMYKLHKINLTIHIC